MWPLRGKAFVSGSIKNNFFAASLSQRSLIIGLIYINFNRDVKWNVYKVLSNFYSLLIIIRFTRLLRHTVYFSVGGLLWRACRRRVVKSSPATTTGSGSERSSCSQGRLKLNDRKNVLKIRICLSSCSVLIWDWNTVIAHWYSQRQWERELIPFTIFKFLGFILLYLFSHFFFNDLYKFFCYTNCSHIRATEPVTTLNCQWYRMIPKIAIYSVNFKLKL